MNKTRHKVPKFLWAPFIGLNPWCSRVVKYCTLERFSPSTWQFSNSRAQDVKIGHRFIVDSISAFFITDNTFRYNRESARSIRIPSLSLLISRRSSSAHVEKLPSVVTRSRLASKHAREFGEEQGLGTKKGKNKNLDSLLSSPWTGAISWVPRRFWNEDSWLPFSP